MDAGQILGSVEVEVKANLDKLVAGFARGRAQAQAFQSEYTSTYNKFARDQIAAQEAATAASKRMALQQVATAEAINKVTRATNPLVANTQLVSGAVRDAEKAYMAGSISAGALARAQQIGLPWLQKTDEAVKENTGSLSGWARSTEHHLRAMRLLIGFVGVYAVEGFAKFAVATLQSTAALKYQADELGLSTAQLQEYTAIAGQVGMSSEDMTSAFKTMGRNIDDLRAGRVGPFSKAVKDLGVQITDTSGKVRDKTAIFNDFVDKLRDVGDLSQRQAGGMVVFGEAIDKMGTLIEGGSSKIEQLREQVREMGLVLSDKQIQDADETAKKLDILGQALKIEFSSAVVKNAKAIEQLATALERVASITLQRIIQEMGALATRVGELATAIQTVANMPMANPLMGGEPSPSASGALHGISQKFGSFKYGPQPYTPGILDKLLGKDNALTKAEHSASRFLGLETGETAQVAAKLPPVPAQPHGPNIKLDNLLSPKGRTPHEKKTKFDEYEQDLEQEKLRQLELEKAATGDIEQQNQLANQIIDLQEQVREQQIDKQVHSGSLTKEEGKALKAQARITADKEKEAAASAMRIALIEQAAQYDSEVNQLTQDGLQIARSLAMTDKERKTIDLAILDSKQSQAKLELQKEISLAAEAKNQDRVVELQHELAQLMANQVAEVKQFDLEHLLPIQQFERAIPTSPGQLTDQIHTQAFDLFNQKLEQAAQFAGDVGDAFGKAAGALARGGKPIEVFTGLISDLADTFTKNFIEKPISDLVTEKVGKPLAQQAFGSQINKLAVQAGGAALSTQQMSVQMDIATGSLTSLAAAASAAAAAMAAGGGGGGGLGGIFGQLMGTTLGSADVAGSLSFSGGDPLSILAGAGYPTFDDGGFTGSGDPKKPKGIVHAGEWVWDAATTKKFWPLISMIGAGRLPSFDGPGVGAMRSQSQPQPLALHIGSLVFPGVTDARTARQSASQAASTLHRKISKVVQKGMGNA